MPPLHRGLARPSALTLHQPATPTAQPALTHTLRPFQFASSRAAPSRAAPPRPTRLPAALPLANATSVRQELENARKGTQDLVLPNGHIHPVRDAQTERKNFLARLTSWIPLFTRLKHSPDAFSTFRHEADVCNRLPAPEHAEPRLVDQPQYLQSVNLWLEILRFRLRLDGQQGAMDVVEAIVNRRVVLPLRGPQAHQIWSILLWSAVQYPQMLRLLYPYLVDALPRSALLEVRLYERIVGPLLRQNPMFAVSWHKRMQSDHLLPLDLVPVLANYIEDACLSNHKSRAIDAFKKIYTTTGLNNLYDQGIPRLCRLSDFSTAVDMHAFFVRHNDHPSPYMRSTPLVAYLAEHIRLARSNMRPSAKARFVNQLMDAQHDFQSLKPAESDTPTENMPPLTRESMSTIVGDVHNIREKELNDAFCARLFATTAFSIDLIITGLRMLGLKIVGNLALREIAARAPAPADYLATMEAIKAAGISVVDSVFSRALQSFAAHQDKHQSFHFLVTSDQHPTAYEDRHLQKKLFGSFLTSGQHGQANAVLDILTLDEPEPENYHANLILQAYARRGRRESTLQILHEMRLHRIPVSEASLRYVSWIALRPRAHSKSPLTQQHYVYKDDLDFTTNVYLETMRTGQSFDPTRWREILRRYGMANRLEALERLCIWLALWYSGRVSDAAKPLLSIPSRGQGLTQEQKGPLAMKKEEQHPLAVVFTEHLLRAIIAWGFKSEEILPEPTTAGELSLPSDMSVESGEVEEGAPTKPEAWARGLALVCKLERLGVSLAHKELRREVKLRLWILHGPGMSTVLANRQMQRKNRLSLVHRVRHVQAIMGKNWFLFPPSVRDRSDISEWTMYRALFGQPRNTRRRTRKDRG